MESDSHTALTFWASEPGDAVIPSISGYSDVFAYWLAISVYAYSFTDLWHSSKTRRPKSARFILLARRSFRTTSGVAKTRLDLPLQVTSLKSAGVFPVRITKSSSGSLMTLRKEDICCMHKGRVGAITNTLLPL